MVMPYQDIKKAIFGKVPMIVTNDEKFPITESQIQPASFDFRLGRTVFRMRSAALPHNENVIDLIERYSKYQFDLGASADKYLEAGMTYIIPLLEACALPKDTHVVFSAKSSTGRVDVFARVLADKVSHYDVVPSGYHGPLYLEVTPLSHDVRVQAGLSLVQGRFKTTETRLVTEKELNELHMKHGILFTAEGKPLSFKDMRIVDNEMYFNVELNRDVVGFISKSTTKPIVMTVQDEDQKHNPEEFWEPIMRPRDGQLVLLPDRFYLLATKERIRVPPECCGQVEAHKTTAGEMRPHYAGFFDNGFGGECGTHGVLEVRSRDVPFRVVDGQPICTIRFEHTFAIPEQLYGVKGSSYTNSGPSLSKHFKFRHEAWELAYWRSC